MDKLIIIAYEKNTKASSVLKDLLQVIDKRIPSDLMYNIVWASRSTLQDLFSIGDTPAEKVAYYYENCDVNENNPPSQTCLAWLLLHSLHNLSADERCGMEVQHFLTSLEDALRKEETRNMFLPEAKKTLAACEKKLHEILFPEKVTL